ncbi:MAG: DUF2786 domain-containing protein [Azospirillum sp.]|nr:DUF2786 domain-containing protein [Azospirillum sp.]
MVSLQRLEEAGRKLGSPDDRAPPAEVLATAELLVDLTLFTAAPFRTTAIERLARQTKPPSESVEARALAALTRHRFALFEITAQRADGGHEARDLLSGAAFPLVAITLAPIAPPGTRLAGRLAVAPETQISIGALVLLDDQALALTQRWLARGGRSVANPVRCAETLYHWAVAEHRVILPGIGEIGDEDSGDVSIPGAAGQFPFGPEDGRIHAVAAAWAALPAGCQPTPDEEHFIRSLTSFDELIEVIQYVRTARACAAPPLAAAYEQVAVLQLETLHRRAAIGHAWAASALSQFEQEIERAVAAREIPPVYRDLFGELNRRARPVGSGGKTTTGDADLDKLRGRIQALRAKTVAQGCTEEEALAAAAKVAELLDRYGLSLSELEMRQQACEGLGIATGRRRRAPIDDSIATIADFCDCRYWIEKSAADELRYVFFGLPADVAGAHYLYDLIASTIGGETAAFKAGALYANHHSSERASATRSFQTGMVHSIVVKLRGLKTQRSQATVSSTGRDLVPVKADIVAEELAKLGIRFTEKSARHSRSVLSEAYQAGRVAGEAFEVNRRVSVAR